MWVNSFELVSIPISICDKLWNFVWFEPSESEKANSNDES